MLKEKGKLNVDIAGAITEFEEIIKEFKLRKDIYRIIFRGKGLEFEGYRDFAPDDDASNIDWKASSRAQKLLVKQYKEERDLRIVFVIDVGSNMVFGSTAKLKCEFMTEAVAALSNVIVKSNDRVGFFLFSDTIRHFVTCKGGKKHFQLFIDILSTSSNYGGQTNLDQALDFAMDYLNNSIHSVIIVSDFLNATMETEKKLSLLGSRFETIAIRVRDPLDLALPNIEGEIILEDPVNHQQVIVNPKVAGKKYARYALEQGKAVEEIFKKTQLDYLDLVTDKPFAEPLAVFLKERLMKKF